MTRNLFALLLLAVLGLGLFLGPHPCSAGHGERESRVSSCHEAETSPDSPEIRESLQQAGDDCCSTFCQHACHVTAIAAAEPVAFAIELASQATVDASGHGLPLFAHPIDHIPLA